jgi:hypothetical protein
MMSKFLELCKLNLNEMIEKKEVGGKELSYLTWAKAWEKFVEYYPDATYEVVKFIAENNTLVPFMLDSTSGYMVNTKVTAGGLTHEMWLPVLDETNKAMRNVPYTYKVKKYEWDKTSRKNKWTGEYTEKVVSPATMFDINTAIMRCLVKNLAMFGLGLYIYAGEDLPKGDSEPPEDVLPEKKINKSTTTIKPSSKGTQKALRELIEVCKNEDELRGVYKENKSAIVADAELLKLVTDKGEEFRKVS